MSEHRLNLHSKGIAPSSEIVGAKGALLPYAQEMPCKSGGVKKIEKCYMIYCGKMVNDTDAQLSTLYNTGNRIAREAKVDELVIPADSGFASSTKGVPLSISKAQVSSFNSRSSGKVSDQNFIQLTETV